MRFILASVFLVLTIGFAQAEPTPSEAFSSKQANQVLDKINLRLSVQNLDPKNLTEAVITLTDLIGKAQFCIEETQAKLTELDPLIKQASTAENKNGADLIYLQKQQKSAAEKQSRCRLFSIRAKEAIHAYKTAIAELKQEQALAKSPALWVLFASANNARFATQTNTLPVHVEQLTPYTLTLGMCAWLTCFLIAYIALRLLCKRHVVTHYFSIKGNRMRLCVAASFALLSLVYFLDTLQHTQDLDLNIPAVYLSALLLSYFASFFLIMGIFIMKRVRKFFFWYSLDNAFFLRLVLALITLNTLRLGGSFFLTHAKADATVTDLARSLYLLLVLLTEGVFIHYFFKAHAHIRTFKKYSTLIQTSSYVVLFAFALLNIIGYHMLARHLTVSGLTTVVIMFITGLLTQGIHKLYVSLYSNSRLNRTVRYYFGYKANTLYTELLIFKTTLQLVAILASIYYIGKSWGFATSTISKIYESLIYGIHFMDLTFYPTRILAGVLVFCMLYLMCRAISTTVIRRQQFEDDDEDTQVAIASLLTYVGFAIAVVSGFFVAGFNFTGLAIIAGALSVGIGLGLQSIVNNFVSGLILLIERPIRPGDRINVDGAEGFVKNIRVRSTQIRTTSNEDIIIPNSDLITRRVTNFMYTDSTCRIHCEVGVAYGSDTEKARDLLLLIASAHEEVLKSAKYKPRVLFRAFADNAMTFQVWCTLKNVNKKYVVQSDLNFAIEKAFRENGINIAFPQRDVHIKWSDIAPALPAVSTTKPPKDEHEAQ